MNANLETTTLGFLVFPGFPMSCVTSAIEPIRAANEISGSKAFAWKLISEHGGKVCSSAGVNFEADAALDQIVGLEYLFLLSGPLGVFSKPDIGNGHLRRLARHGLKIGGVSGGVFPLARSGILDIGQACSVHWCYEAAFKAEFPDHNITNKVIEIDRNIYTVSGATAVFDLMLSLIAEKLGPDVATEVACWFQHPLVRGQGDRQVLPTASNHGTSDRLPNVVSRAVELFENHVSDPISICNTAKRIGVSPRQLERVFKAETGQNPSQYYRGMRLKAARQLVIYTSDTMMQIANAVGYTTTAPMIQHYRQAFGLSPKEDRRKINRFRVQNNREIPPG